VPIDHEDFCDQCLPKFKAFLDWFIRAAGPARPTITHADEAWLRRQLEGLGKGDTYGR